MEDVIKFLEKNGFKKVEQNSYDNNVCSVVLNTSGYIISDNNGNLVCLNGLLIYTLIGYLTYQGFMDKNYKQ